MSIAKFLNFASMNTSSVLLHVKKRCSNIWLPLYFSPHVVVIIACFTALTLLPSCDKDDKVESRFSWTYDGATYLAKQHAANTSGMGAPSIIASLETSIVAPGAGTRINLVSLQPGTYSISSGTGNRFDYIDNAGNIHTGSSGNVIISKNTGNLLSGNFSVTLVNKTITGEFANTPIK